MLTPEKRNFRTHIQLLAKFFLPNGENAILAVSELLLNANSAIFQLYHGKNKLIFIEMIVRSALY